MSDTAARATGGWSWHVLSTLSALGLVALLLNTYGRLSHTADEPMHVACGLEWHAAGTHLLKPENPPLAQILVGLGAHLDGQRLPEAGAPFRRGRELLYAGGDYGRRLARARLGTLPFFLLALAGVWAWARHLAGARAACLASVAFGWLPPVLGHSGLATTDVPFLATFLWLLFAALLWLERPSVRRAAWLGLALGTCVATKFSVLVFGPPCVAVLLGMRWRWGRAESPLRSELDRGTVLRTLAAVLFPALLVVWAVYRFSVGSAASLEGTERLLLHAFPGQGLGHSLASFVARLWCLAPEFLVGLLALYAHITGGHSAYLLGQESASGFAWFYPIVLGVKTPPVFWLTTALGLAGLRHLRGPRWRALVPAVLALTVLLVAMPSTINIGVRHVLVIYPLLAISLAVGLDAWLAHSGPRVSWAVALLLGLQVLTVWRAHPDHLGYFNALAGDEPGEVLLDSDLDWGQDILQLVEVLEGESVPELHIAVFGSARLCEHDLPPLRWLAPGEPVTGWVAISEMYFRHHWDLYYDDACERDRPRASEVQQGYAWLADHEPVARAGASIRVYFIPEG